MSDKELYDRIEAYFNAHNFNAQLLSYGACGIRNFESDNNTTTIEYVKVSLESLLKAYKTTRSQIKHLDDWIKEGSVRIPKVSSSNNHDILQQEEILVEPWKIKSYYISHTLTSHYHLHPKLVDTDDGGVEYTFLCPICYKEYKVGKCYKLSITAGINFGNYQRITELES